MARKYFGVEMKDRAFLLMASGVSMDAASRITGVSATHLRRWWREVGGMTLRAGARGGTGIVVRLDQLQEPGPKGSRLNLFERITIQAGLAQGRSDRDIGRQIRRPGSTVCRERLRNGHNGTYHAGIAAARAAVNACRPKSFKLLGNRKLCLLINTWMDDGWSPKLISLVLRLEFHDDVNMQISHETIYQCLYVQTRGELRKDLYRQLSLGRSKRVPERSKRGTDRRGKLSEDAFKIADRPAEVQDRAVPGHWEGDLITGTENGSAIGTLVERTSRYTILLYLPGKHGAEEVATAMIEAMKDLPEHLRRSMTWDRGSEMAQFERIQIELGTPVYFCDPRSPWQRGTNENTNRLLRHWFPKGTDLRVHSAADLKRVQDTLNRRPRPTLGMQTPTQRLAEIIGQQAA
ncbi:IS30 family transposase [Nakamurella silvestris]|nr:IS30 family transposase [Nakamurella silvestris]